NPLLTIVPLFYFTAPLIAYCYFLIRYIKVKIKEISKYPNTPPRVFKIKSSTSKLPNLNTSWVSSKAKLKQNVAKVITFEFKKILDNKGIRKPNGIKPITFPAKFSIRTLKLKSVAEKR